LSWIEIELAGACDSGPLDQTKIENKYNNNNNNNNTPFLKK
jgi:hypothetical protein